MTTNHAEPAIITYESQYGSAEHYARKFADGKQVSFEEDTAVTELAIIIDRG